MTYIKINGMTCQKGCASTIEKALNECDQIEQAKVHFDQQLAEVELKETSHWEAADIVKAIEQVNSNKFTAEVTNDFRIVILTIQGMNCSKNCAPKVKKAIEAVDGVILATVNFDRKVVTVLMQRDSTNTGVELIRAVRGIASRFDASVGERSRDEVPVNSRQVIVNIEGMSCMKRCGTKIEDALNGMSGVLCACVDFANKSALVTLDPASRITEDHLIDTINGLSSKFKAYTDLKPYRASPVIDREKVESPDITIAIPDKDYSELKIMLGGMTCNSCANAYVD